MKGLLVKDLRLLMQRRESFAVMLLLAVFMGFSGNGVIFVMGYFPILWLMLAVGTISYDELDHGLSFLLTLPVTRRTYVLEKYILCMAAEVLGGVFAVVWAAVLNLFTGNSFSEYFILQAVVCLIAACWMMALQIPMQLKFGAEKSRIILIGTVAGITAVVVGVLKLAEKQSQNGAVWSIMVFGNMQGGLFAAGTLLTVLALIASCFIACRILEKKEV